MPPGPRRGARSQWWPAGPLRPLEVAGVRQHHGEAVHGCRCRVSVVRRNHPVVQPSCAGEVVSRGPNVGQAQHGRRGMVGLVGVGCPGEGLNGRGFVALPLEQEAERDPGPCGDLGLGRAGGLDERFLGDGRLALHPGRQPDQDGRGLLGVIVRVRARANRQVASDNGLECILGPGDDGVRSRVAIRSVDGSGAPYECRCVPAHLLGRPVEPLTERLVGHEPARRDLLQCHLGKVAQAPVVDGAAGHARSLPVRGRFGDGHPNGFIRPVILEPVAEQPDRGEELRQLGQAATVRQRGVEPLCLLHLRLGKSGVEHEPDRSVPQKSLQPRIDQFDDVELEAVDGHGDDDARIDLREPSQIVRGEPALQVSLRIIDPDHQLAGERSSESDEGRDRLLGWSRLQPFEWIAQRNHAVVGELAHGLPRAPVTSRSRDRLARPRHGAVRVSDSSVSACSRRASMLRGT